MLAVRSAYHRTGQSKARVEVVTAHCGTPMAIRDEESWPNRLRI